MDNVENCILYNESGNNILEYSKYINEIIKKESIIGLINLFNLNERQIFNTIRYKLMQFEEILTFFEKEIENCLRKNYFEYSIISIVICERKGIKDYLNERKKCPNCHKRFLFYPTQIDHISKILTNNLKYSRKPFYGIGIYFTDMIDYAGLFGGEETYQKRKYNFNRIIPIKETLSCISSEIYYDEQKYKNIYDYSFFVKPLDHFPTYEEIKSKYKDKMVIKNGIHSVKVNVEDFEVLDKDKIKEYIEKGNFIANEFVITEFDQIFSLLGLIFQRDEYFAIWYDNNFINKKYLFKEKLFFNKISKIKIYFEIYLEEALKLISRKKYNKIILIANIGLDLSGKKFVDIARKILGFDAVVLIFTNDIKHFNWLKNYTNVLITNSKDYYKRYIFDYNKKGLLELKKDIEKKYNFKLKEFTDDFINFPKFINDGYASQINFSDYSEYFRHVKIYNNLTGYYINMNKDGTLSLNKNNGNIWDITLYNDEITLFSNSYYLSIKDDNDQVNGSKLMRIGNFIKYKDKYTIIFGKKILSIQTNDGIKFKNCKIGEYEKFKFIDCLIEF